MKFKNFLLLRRCECILFQSFEAARAGETTLIRRFQSIDLLIRHLPNNSVRPTKHIEKNKCLID